MTIVVGNDYGRALAGNVFEVVGFQSDEDSDEWPNYTGEKNKFWKVSGAHQ